MNHTRTIRLPIHVMKELNACLKVTGELAEELDRLPTERNSQTLAQAREKDSLTAAP